MDDGQGRMRLSDSLDELEKIKTEFPKHGGIFSVGEEVNLRGSQFKVKSIKPRGLTLKLLKRTEPIKKVEEINVWEKACRNFLTGCSNTVGKEPETCNECVEIFCNHLRELLKESEGVQWGKS